jgi:hypothetical protein
MSITQHLAHLGNVESDLLLAAAVLGGRVTDQRLMQVIPVDEDEALRALDVLTQNRLLRESEEDEGYDFTNALIREAVVAAAGTARRRMFQRRALVVLENVASQPDSVREALAC